MFSKTLTLNSSTLFLASHHSLSPQPPLPLSFSLLSSGSTLPLIPPDFPQSKLIPKTRFVVDGFRHAGDYSVSYFLSHFHSDHYTGLAPNWCKGIVFCSPTTARLLIKVLKIPASFVVPLPLSERVSIDGCEISLVDANHCPGAVQFVFKIPGNDGKIERYVHTGDFRYCDSMKSDPILCEYNGADAVFLDTTYCNPKYVFPSQEESIDYIANVIEKIGVQNEGSKKSVLFLVATYVIGKEKILLEVSRRCNRKIHVDSRKMAILGVLGFGQGVFTEVESETDVHVVGWSVLGETWPYFRPNFAKIEEIMIERGYSKVVGFVPTGWTYEVKRNKFAVRTKESMEIHLVPYSEHSNYDELRRYVKFLKPKHVVPTVGTDANEIHKHFVGLVDEMAVKKEFLLGYLREGSKENDVDLGNVEHSTSSKQQPCTRDLVSENDDEVEELVRELRDCLPTWVTRDQMLDLLSGSSKNVVEAVSNFYENETEFREQVTASSSPACTSQEIPFIKPCSVKSSPETKEVFLSQSYKTPLVAKLSKSSASSKKRRKNMENKSTKKARVKPSVESSGPKQCTITRFFGKLGQNVSQGGGVETSLNQCRDDKKLSELDDVQPYKEEVNRFIQIIHGNESLRSYASTILEEAKGDINMALDIYYSNPMGSSIEKNDQCSTIISIDQEKELSEKSGLLSDNVESTSVSLPPEKYSPVEDACWRGGEPAPYMHLARTFDLVEKEKGKIKATSMLCNMFRSLLALSPEDVLPAVYLCTNKIAPDHENMELNIGGSIVVAAIEETCGTNKAKIGDLYKSLGDLGDVAQVCRQTQSLLVSPAPLSVRGVYAALKRVSAQTGSGSTTRKKIIIVNLMRSCREKEMKFLVRTLVRNLRIGAMMRTVLPALAQAFAMNSSLREGTAEDLKKHLQRLSMAVVEAYNMLPNLDLLIPSLLDKGITFSSTTLSMVPGIPIKPMLAKITNGIPQVLKLFQNKAFTCEYKYDGQRAQVHRLDDGSVRVFSRNGDETTSRFPDLINIINEICIPAAAATFILDAEVVAVDRKNNCKLMSFQELSSRERGSKDALITLDSIKVAICVFVFDIMFANGEQLLGYPLRQRRKYLKDLFGNEKLGYFEYAKEMTVEADDAFASNETTLNRMNCFLDDALRSSCEGIMVKSLDVDAGYTPSKRSDSWLKVKRDYVEGLNDSLDLVPIGAWYGNGRKAGWYSPFLLACYNPDTEEFQSVCRVMSGFSDSFYIEMKEFFSGDKILSRKPLYYQTSEVPEIWFSPELVWEIRGADFTLSPVHRAAIGLVHPNRGISMRFPRFIQSVSDRKPEECSAAEDLAEMFLSQTRKMDVNIEN